MKNPSLAWRNRAGMVLCLLASLQMLGDVTGWLPLAGLSAAWGVSPRPKVFSSVDGLEPFASTFTMTWVGPDGASERLEITPALYSRLSGPYNRRNVYGAALAYAPRLPDALWQPVYCYGLATDGPLRSEFGLPAQTEGLATELATRTRGRDDRWVLQPGCG